MKKILFACDLDNTLIHSLKHKKDDDVCIERIGDKEQGFMSQRTLELLNQLSNEVEIIPITTRSIEQYKRIMWPNGNAPRFAVVSNGAILLDNGFPQKEWKEKHDKLVAPLSSTMKRIEEELIKQNKYIRVRIVDDMYLFAYCKDGVNINDCVSENKLQTDFNVVSSGRKLYFFPHGIDKGNALQELKSMFSPKLIISAGDSSIDLPMLDRSDIAIVPSSFLAEKIGNSQVYLKNKEEMFAEFVLTKVKELVGKII